MSPRQRRALVALNAGVFACLLVLSVTRIAGIESALIDRALVGLEVACLAGILLVHHATGALRTRFLVLAFVIVPLVILAVRGMLRH